MQILMSHPTGNSNVRAVIKTLCQENLLAEFNTTIGLSSDHYLMSILSNRLGDQLSRRSFPLSSGMLKSHPLTEIARLMLPKLGLKRFVKQEHSWASIDSVYRNLDHHVARRIIARRSTKDYTAVYGYEDGALESFRAAKERGLTCIYDLPIAYWETSRRLMKEEAIRLPEWAITLAGGIRDSAEKLERKTQELELADIVVAPGDFVLASIPTWAKNKHMVLAPFGSPTTGALFTKSSSTKENSKLRVLFAGSMSQRKGLGDLFNAMKLLDTDKIELIVMGSLMAPMAFYRAQFPSFTYMPNRPHHQVLELMRSCDVLCLPSIVEGRALVMQEAMSQGLPIIITAHTGGADLIIEEKTGFLIPIRSPEAIAEKLSWFLKKKTRISEMRVHARTHAAAYTWETYGATIVSAIREFQTSHEYA